MLSQEWIEMFRVLPEEMRSNIVVVLQNGSELSIDTFFRFEPNFLVARGRVAGTLDENRAFFIPYNQMLYYRLDRNIKLEELEEIFLNRTEAALEAEPAPTIPIPAPVPSGNGSSQSIDPNSTRNALLERIRAARATQGPAR
jgi:hypothetical protein